MIGAALNSALQGLQSASQRTATASRNIAGATVVGYVRREASYSSGPLGLQFNGIIRNTDPELKATADHERTGLAGLEIELLGSTAVADRLGDPREGNDLGTALQTLADGFTRLGDRPEDPTVQNDVLQHAQNVARFLNTASETIQDQRLQADRTIAGDVATVNEQLAIIHDLNEKIGSAPAGSDVSDFLDQRGQALAAVAERIPLRVVEQGKGALTVLSDKGIVLVDSRVHALTFTATQAIEPASSYGGAPALSGLTVDGIDITPGSGKPQAPAGGRLAAAFGLRDVTLPRQQSQLDEVARVLAQSFHAADPTISGSPTVPGLFTEDGGVPSGAPGLALRLAVNAAVDPAQGGDAWKLRTGVAASTQGEPGDGTQARAFSIIFDVHHDFDTGVGLSPRSTLTAWANELTASAGRARTSLESSVEYQSSLVTALDTRLADKQGVDLDKELQDTLLFEKSYAASATVLQTANEMLDTLLRRFA